MLQTFSNFQKFVKLAKGLKEFRKSDNAIAKAKSAQFLNQFFSENKGLIHKIGQFQGLHHGALPEMAGLSEAHVEKFEVAHLSERLAELYHQDPSEIFLEVSETAKSASLSSVFLVKLSSRPGLWALKLQTEGIRQEIDSTLTLLGLIPGAGPVKKWGIPLDKYKQELAESLNRELNFRFERQCMQEIRGLANQPAWLIIPEVLPELCTEECLVMSYEEGFPLSCAKTWEPEIRKQIAEKLIELFLLQMLKWPLFQTDWNAGNFLYRRTLNHIDVIGLDFGSYFPMNSLQQAGVNNLFRRLQNENLDGCIHDLVLAGFDPQKLSNISDKVDNIITAMFKPFLTQTEVNIHDWNYSQDIDKELGELKWWFRSSGSPQLFHFVRAYSLFIQSIKILNVAVSFRDILGKLELGPLDTSTTQALPKLVAGPKWQSNWLKVRVQDQRTNEEIVAISLPIHSIHNLNDILPEDVSAQLQHDKIEVDQLVNQFTQTNGQPQKLFSLQRNNKSYLVWTEE